MDNMVPPSFAEAPADPCDLDYRSVVSDVAVDTRTTYEAWSDSMVSDPAWYSADTIAQQTRTLDTELDTELETELDALQLAETLLPGFETLTWSDLDRAARRDCAIQTDCTVSWCIHQGLPVHSDGYDPDPDNAPHRSVEHTIRTIHGGENIDRTGHAEVTAQLEQDHDQTTGPTITLTVAVRGIEQYAWLTLPETRALQNALDHLLTEASPGADIG